MNGRGKGRALRSLLLSIIFRINNACDISHTSRGSELTMMTWNTCVFYDPSVSIGESFHRESERERGGGWVCIDKDTLIPSPCVSPTHPSSALSIPREGGAMNESSSLFLSRPRRKRQTRNPLFLLEIFEQTNDEKKKVSSIPSLSLSHFLSSAPPPSFPDH